MRKEVTCGGTGGYPGYTVNDTYKVDDIVENVSSLYEYMTALRCNGPSRFYAPGVDPEWLTVWKRFQDSGEIDPPPPNPPQAVIVGNVYAVATTSTGFVYPMDGSKSLRAAKYQWENRSGPSSVRNAESALAELVVAKNQIGESIFELTVTNKGGKQHIAIVKVKVVVANVNISGATSILAGQVTSLEAQANFSGAGIVALTYRWKVQNAHSSEIMQGAQQQLP
ncbi:MAG: hypothetical protein H7240_09050 [Glaciimonas sp.]|nr:hypothetical protein [Glaciimonas sp.]